MNCVYLYKDSGLGDIMLSSLLTDDIGRVIAARDAGFDVHVVVCSHNKFSYQWYDWIPGVSVHSLPYERFPGDHYRSDSMKERIAESLPQLVGATPIDTTFPSAPFTYPRYDRPDRAVVVQPFAGTAGRNVFDEHLISLLDREGVIFIGKADSRDGAYIDGDSVEVMPPVSRATDWTNQLSVMETFQLVREARLFFGTFSCFWLIAQYFGVDCACLSPRIHVEHFVYGGSNHLHPQFSVLPYYRYDRTYRVYIREDRTNDAIISAIQRDFGGALCPTD